MRRKCLFAGLSLLLLFNPLFGQEDGLSQPDVAGALSRIREIATGLKDEQIMLLDELRADLNPSVNRLKEHPEFYRDMEEIIHQPNNYHKKLLVNQYGFLQAFLKHRKKIGPLPFEPIDVLVYFVLNPKHTQTVYRKAFDIVDYSYMTDQFEDVSRDPGKSYRSKDRFLRLALNDSIISNLRKFDNLVRYGVIKPSETYVPDEFLEKDLDRFLGKVDVEKLYKVINWYFSVHDKSRADAIKTAYYLMSPRPNFYMEEQEKDNQNRVIFVREYLEKLGGSDYRGALRGLRSRLDSLAEVLEKASTPSELRRLGCLDRNVFDITNSIVNDPEKALEILGILCSQRLSLYYGLKDFLIRKGVFHEYVEALKDASVIHFQLFRINFLFERIMKKTGSNSNFFTYPKGFSSANNAYYHFWAAAYIARILNRQGVSAEDNLWVAGKIALAYESATFPIAAFSELFHGASLFEVVKNNIASTKEDIDLHLKGARFALSF